VTRDITAALRAWSAGELDAGDALIRLVYADLRRQAALYMSRERPDHTLDPAGLVHEVYLRLHDQREIVWQSRAHFFGVASQMMRRILVDHARRRGSTKRGGAWRKVRFDDGAIAVDPGFDVAALDAALHELAALDPRQAQMVELRFFVGLSIDEVAEVVGVSPTTVKREWRVAKAWLYRHVHGSAQ
jgi:RNA polymerase sigma factor (TIGR02999 family)